MSKSRKQGAPKKRAAGRLSYLDQREYDTIEERIVTAEKDKERFEQALTDPEIASDPERLSKSWEELEACQTQIEALYQRWEELERKKEEGG